MAKSTTVRKLREVYPLLSKRGKAGSQLSPYETHCNNKSKNDRIVQNKVTVLVKKKLCSQFSRK